MNVKTLEDYRKIAYFTEGEKEVNRVHFVELLEKAEKLHEENQWLYGKLNIISGVIEDGREELLKK